VTAQLINKFGHTEKQGNDDEYVWIGEETIIATAAKYDCFYCCFASAQAFANNIIKEYEADAKAAEPDL